MKIGVFILEDNPITARDLKEIIELQNMEILGVCYSGEEAMDVIHNIHPDILLVDIKLKGPMTGIEFVHQVSELRNIPVVYLTANSDRQTVKSAIETVPAAFITKPFDEKDLVIAIELAFKNHAAKSISANGHSKTPYIFIKGTDQFEKVAIDDIHYLEAEGSYSKVFTYNKEYLLSGNLNQYKNLCQNFLRIHRSYIVNINNITGIDSNHVFVKEKALPIGRSHKDQIKDVLKKFS